jgi:3-hydroxybutyryl-CoA dehydratase
MPRATQLFADDLPVGFRFSGERKALTEERFRQFAAMTGDAHPIHYDPAYAADTRFGKPIAHGLLLTSLTALGATEMSASFEDAMIAMVEQRMQFRNPGFAGDVVVAEYEVVSNSATGSGRSARIEIGITLRNQAGACLLEGYHVYLFRRRPGGTSPMSG